MLLALLLQLELVHCHLLADCLLARPEVLGLLVGSDHLARLKVGVEEHGLGRLLLRRLRLRLFYLVPHVVVRHARAEMVVVDTYISQGSEGRLFSCLGGVCSTYLHDRWLHLRVRRGEEGEKRDERGVDLQHLAQVEEVGQVLPRIVAAVPELCTGMGGKGRGQASVTRVVNHSINQSSNQSTDQLSFT